MSIVIYFTVIIQLHSYIFRFNSQCFYKVISLSFNGKRSRKVLFFYSWLVLNLAYRFIHFIYRTVIGFLYSVGFGGCRILLSQLMVL